MAYDELTAPGQVAEGRRTDARAVFGQVMGLVAICSAAAGTSTRRHP